ncbi:hypothetical protein DESPIG_01833 [Desulfovibrio piger ATCC 29098]|uniref:Uncharacterized protein n=1 Tax=Desulfovibrio piger ATCC 29098 TaxID=411464 RepID=B6WUS1_9BACT|nr:hypothetical protein DESPIG_01833 [Desulfovibrio piger ATCC 29098]
MLPPSARPDTPVFPAAKTGPELSDFSENLSFFSENHKSPARAITTTHSIIH